MHEHKIVHRDLKPPNIIVCNDGSLRIIDLGIAKAAEMRRINLCRLPSNAGHAGLYGAGAGEGDSAATWVGLVIIVAGGMVIQFGGRH